MIRIDEPSEMALVLGRIAMERKAKDLIVLDLRGLCSFTDFMLILSGRSTRQVQAIGDHILRQAKKGFKLTPLGSEGTGQGNWVLIDYGDVIIHIFLDEIREYYDLEGLWSDAPRFEWTDEGGEPELKSAR